MNYIVSQNEQTITKMGTLNIQKQNEQYIIVNQEDYIMGTYDNQKRCEEIMKDIIKKFAGGSGIYLAKDPNYNELTGWVNNNIYYMPKE